MKQIAVFIILSIIISSCSILYMPSSTDCINKDAYHFYKLAYKQENKGSLDSALYYFNKADQADPDNPKILHARGLAKYKISYVKRHDPKYFNTNINYEDAITDLNKAIELETNSKLLHKSYYPNRALVFLEMGEMDNACSDWKIADERYYLRKYCNKK